jgi:hypothetical protein
MIFSIAFFRRAALFLRAVQYDWSRLTLSCLPSLLQIHRDFASADDMFQCYALDIAFGQASNKTQCEKNTTLDHWIFHGPALRDAFVRARHRNGHDL